ncbi:hypothetical protein AVEN_207894-1, partial [Araneus ventricosus]
FPEGHVRETDSSLSRSAVKAKSTASQTAENAPVVRKPYSPFQNTGSKMEYALARVDDLLNWARKVCKAKI